MSFVWAEYLKVADDLLAYKQRSASDEAAMRAAISRAYYAAYHAAYAEMAARGKMAGTSGLTGTHSIVLQALFSVRDRAWSKVGIEFDELRKARVHVDYKPLLPREWVKNESTLEEKATYFIDRARWLVQALPSLP